MSFKVTPSMVKLLTKIILISLLSQRRIIVRKALDLQDFGVMVGAQWRIQLLIALGGLPRARVSVGVWMHTGQLINSVCSLSDKSWQSYWNIEQKRKLCLTLLFNLFSAHLNNDNMLIIIVFTRLNYSKPIKAKVKRAAAEHVPAPYGCSRMPLPQEAFRALAVVYKLHGDMHRSKLLRRHLQIWLDLKTFLFNVQH